MNFTSTLRVSIDGRAAQTGAAQVSAATQQVENRAFRLRRTLYDLRFALVSIGGIAVTRGIFRLNDAFTEQEGRLRLVTNSEQELVRVRKALFDISQQTFTSVDATTTLYARTTRAVRSMNLTEERRLALVQSINQAVTLSNSTTQEAEGAIRQLTQGLSSGVIRGQEYNSIIEQTPEVLGVVQDYLGVTTGKLREMANDGQLTAKLFVTAFTEMEESIRLRYEQGVTITVGRAFTNLSNALAAFVGESTQFESASQVVVAAMQKLTAALQGAAGAFDTLVDAVAVLGGVWLARKLPAAVAVAQKAVYGLSAAIGGALIGGAGKATAVMSGLVKVLGGIPGIVLGAAGGIAALVIQNDRGRAAAAEHKEEMLGLADALDQIDAREAERRIMQIDDAIEEQQAIISEWEGRWSTVIRDIFGEENWTGTEKIREATEYTEELRAAQAKLAAVRLQDWLQELRGKWLEYIDTTEEERIVGEKQLERFRKLMETLDPVTAATNKYLRELDDLRAGYAAGTQQSIPFEEAVKRLAEAFGTQMQALTGTNEELDRYKERTDDMIRSTMPALSALLDEMDESSDWLPEDLEIKFGDVEDRVKSVGTALDTAKEKADPFGEALTRAVERVDEAFVSLWESAFRGFESFADALKSAFTRLLATLAHNAITRPIVIPMMAGLGFSGSATAAGLGFSGGAGSLFAGGTGLLGGTLFGSPVPIMSSGGLFGAPVFGMTTGGLFSGFSGFSGGLGAGFGQLGSTLLGGGAGGGSLLATLGAWAGVLGVGAMIANVLGAFDDPGKTTPRIGLTTNRLLEGINDPNNPDRANLEQYVTPYTYGTDLGVTVQGTQITEAFSPDGQAAQAFLRGIVDFDAAVSQALSFAAPEIEDDIREAVKQALLGPGGERTDLFTGDINVEQALQMRFDRVLSAVDPAIRRFVEEAGDSLEQQVEALASGLRLDALLREGGIFEDLEDAFAQLGDYQLDGETFGDTVTRVVGSMELLREAFGALGVDVADLGDRWIQVSAEFAEAAGGVERARQLWVAFFEGFLSEAERVDMQVNVLRRQAEIEFADIGLDRPLEEYTREGLRTMFEDLLPTLTGEQLNAWLEALAAFSAWLNAIPDQIEEATDQPDRSGFHIGSIGVSGPFQPPAANDSPYRYDWSDTIPVTVVNTEELTAAVRAEEERIAGRAQNTANALFGTPLQRIERRIQELEESFGPDGPTMQQRSTLFFMNRERDALIAQEQAARNLELGTSLAQDLADLSGIRGTSFADVAGTLGFDLEMLADVLGMTMPALTDYLRDLQDNSVTLENLDALINGAASTIADAFNGVFKDGPESFQGKVEAAGQNMMFAADRMVAASEIMLAASDLRPAANQTPSRRSSQVAVRRVVDA
jgi:tape measure domain-containing protein